MHHNREFKIHVIWIHAPELEGSSNEFFLAAAKTVLSATMKNAAPVTAM